MVKHKETVSKVNMVPEIPGTIIWSEKSQNDNQNNPWDDPSLTCMSLTEKRILASITGPTPELPYPLNPLPLRNDAPTMEYIIPESDKAAVLRQLYPFSPCPELHEIRFDLHEEKYFRVGDYKVIRELGWNFIVSPYYANSGGMVIDWMEKDSDGQVLIIPIEK
ncbi:MAG: hypothetical protein GX946_00635 [Oligosphaeraceae bacterium]|nr:hypothetical protein [Oligosphaeraceae bacterium]